MPAPKLTRLAKLLPNSSLCVLPSSVCPGFGVYALRKIPKNTLIGQYPGSLITDDADDHLRDLLRIWRNEDSTQDHSKIRILKRYFNVSIERLLPQRFRYQTPMPLGSDVAVNWRKVLITIYSYSFQTDSGTLVPSRISAAGPPLFSLDQYEASPDDSALTPFINEAPTGTFRNMLTCRTQRPFYNVDVTIEGEHVIFFTKRSIPAGNELFFFYGPSYNRDYPIHMAAANCGWGPKQYEEEDEENKALTAEFYDQQREFKETTTILNFITQVRKKDLQLNLSAIHNKHDSKNEN
jgi:hypothetical protein